MSMPSFLFDSLPLFFKLSPCNHIHVFMVYRYFVSVKFQDNSKFKIFHKVLRVIIKLVLEFKTSWEERCNVVYTRS